MRGLPESFLYSAETRNALIPGTSIRFGISSTARVHSRVRGAGDDHFVVSWMLTGRGTYEEDGKKYPIEGTCFCLRRPDREWKLYLDESRSVRLYLNLPDEIYPALCLLIPELAALPPVRPVAYRRELLDEFLSLMADMEKVSATDFYLLFPRLVRYIQDLTGITDRRTATPLTRARALLEDTSSHSTLEEIASSCGMGYHTFRKQFSDTFGISPGQYRTRCRLEEACRALSLGESISDLSARLGFSDVSTFSHRFSSIVGVSPAKYREKYIK